MTPQNSYSDCADVTWRGSCSRQVDNDYQESWLVGSRQPCAIRRSVMMTMMMTVSESDLEPRGLRTGTRKLVSEYDGAVPCSECSH